MHRLRWSVGILVAFVLETAAWAQFGPALVETAAVMEKKNMTGGHTFVGTVMPLKRSVVGSAVNGRVVELAVNEGDRVSKGQPLARLLTRALEIQIAAARAERDLRLHELAELKNGSRPEEVREAKAQREVAQAVLDHARAKLKRTQILIERNASTGDELDDAVRANLAADNNHSASVARFEMVMQGPRKEKIDQAAARLAVAEEEVNRLLDQLEKHTMIAPFDGYVVKEHTEVGQWITSGEVVAEVVQVDQLEIEVLVLESYVPRLRVGAVARIEVPAIPDEAFEGHVAAIVPQAEVRSRSFPVKVRMSNRLTEDGQPLIKPGMLARVALPVVPRDSLLLVPKDSLVLGGPDPVVYVAEVDPIDATKRRARAVPVKTGVADGSLVEVVGPLKPGDRVVVEGNERLMNGQELRSKP